MKRLTLILLTAAAGALCMASSPGVLTLDRAVALARENYPAIAQYGLLERSTAFSLDNVTKAWLPQGGVMAQVTWQNDVATLPDMLTEMMASRGIDYPGLQKTQYKVGLDLQQQIWDGGRTAASRKAKRAAAEVERSGLDVEIYDVEGRVEELYFSLLLLDENIARTETTIALMDSTLTRMQSMMANGVSTQADCDQVEARILTTKQQLTRLRASEKAYRRVLEIFLGQGLDGLELTTPEMPEPKAAERPQMRLFDARIANIAAQEAGVKASVMPSAGAFASAYYGYPGLNMFKNMRSHDPGFNFFAGITLSWNFGSLYTRSNSLKALQKQRERVEADRALYLFNSEMAQSDATGRIDALREQMKSDERIVELRRAVEKSAQSQLRNGVIDTTSLLSKITDAEIAEIDLSTHRIQLIKELYNLNRIRNK